MSHSHSSKISGQTIKDYTLQIKLNGSLGNEEEQLDEWLTWPPDIFALTSIILQRTGCYRITLIDTEWWESKGWQNNVKAKGQKWINEVGKLILEETTKDELYRSLGKDDTLSPPEFSIYGIWWEILKSEFDIDTLRTISSTEFNKFNKSNPIKEHYRIARLLTILHVFSDAACRAMGLTGLHVDASHRSSSAAHCLANLLLVSTGSLSTLPKTYGAVYPKMRTPQSGMTIRSLSFHLTFHTTEIEVMWRTIPWPDNHEQSINLLLVPHPYTVSTDHFEKFPDKFHRVQYFGAKTSGFDRSLINGVVDLFIKKSAEIGQIHFLVFPEMALSEEEYNYLLLRFKNRLMGDKGLDQVTQKDFRLPVIVAGVVSKTRNGEESATSEAEIVLENEIRIASYFAGRWYNVEQAKHHRWLLDKKQIVQYNFENKFSTERSWFELLSVAQRRLTVLAPNDWLVMVAMMCEDLANMEPAASVIKGIGPSLLTALAADGPQLDNRWSARYAGTLADDPGTSVLSLTSYGMSKRARKQSQTGVYENNPDPYQTVGLWKDIVNGTRSIGIKPSQSDKKEAVLLNISAKFKEEFTLDGRGDGTAAAVLEWQGVSGTDIPEDKKGENGTGEILSELADWNDIRQLSAFLFTLNSLIDLYQDPGIGNDKKEAHAKILLDVMGGKLPSDTTRDKAPRIYLIKEKTVSSWSDPSKSGIQSANGTDENKNSWSENSQITIPISIAEAILSKIFASNNSIKYFNFIVDESLKYHDLISDYIELNIVTEYSKGILDNLDKIKSQVHDLKINFTGNNNSTLAEEHHKEGMKKLEEKLKYNEDILERLLKSPSPSFNDGEIIEEGLESIKYIREFLSNNNTHIFDPIKGSLPEKNNSILELYGEFIKNSVPFLKEIIEDIKSIHVKTEGKEYKKKELDIRILLAVPVMVVSIIDNKLIKIVENYTYEEEISPNYREEIVKLRKEIKKFLNKNYPQNFIKSI